MGACRPTSPEDEISLLELFRRVAVLRAFEETRLALWRAGRIAGDLYLALGQEATAAGLAAGLASGDRLMTSRRGLLLHLARGQDVEAVLRRSPRPDPGQSIAAGHLPVAVGQAVAARLAGSSTICLAEFGDGAASEGLYHEALQMAARWQAPVLFALVNNGYAGATASMPEAVEAALASAAALGLPVARVDGQDAPEVLEEARRLVADVRMRRGPALIECRTYRCVPHVLSSGDGVGDARPAPEIDFWRNRDPLRRLQLSLVQRGLAGADTLDVIADAARAEVASAAHRIFGALPSVGSVGLAPHRATTEGEAA